VLIAAKADLAYANYHGMTALHHAVYYSRASICRVLVDEGASLTAIDRAGQTPLESAKAPGNAECVAILEAAGAVLPPAVAAAYAFVDEHVATTRGFRFAVTKAADEQAPPGLDK
jgi:ankyrin repeat protein